jgi:hypothetical protein
MSVSYAICILCSFFLFRKQEANRRVVLQMGSVYGNVGFMGIPLVQSVFGQEGLIYCVVGVVLFNILIWAHGATIMGGRVVPRRYFPQPRHRRYGRGYGAVYYFYPVARTGTQGGGISGRP